MLDWEIWKAVKDDVITGGIFFFFPALLFLGLFFTINYFCKWKKKHFKKTLRQ